jgi:pimeloyl-ACP methyl ester carboxylesterase
MQIRSNGIVIETEMHGAPDAAPVLMITGLGMQLTAWPAPLLSALQAGGMRPIVFDNRDIGLSTGFDDRGRANLFKAGMQYGFGLPVRSAYTLADMADDALGLLDALGVARAHVVGVSMGGMIAQLLTARAPDRIATATLMMTTSGARHLPGPTPLARLAMLSRPRGREIEALVDHGAGVLRSIASPAFPPDERQLRARVEAAVRRSYRPEGLARQLVAIMASGDRSAAVRTIARPVLVLHGQADPLVPAACGADLAQKIPGARLELVDGMGHDLPEPLLPRLAHILLEHFRRA